jgi:hypothetical protein
MLRAILTTIFILMFARLAVWAARLLTGGRRDEEISLGSAADRSRGPDQARRSGRDGRRSAGPRVAPGEIVDVPFTEIPPAESPKRM